MECQSKSAVVFAVVVSMMMTTTSTLINGPEPMNIIAALGATVSFTCVMNTTKLSGGIFQSYFWIVGDVSLSGDVDSEITNGSLEISTLQRTVTHDFVTTTSFIQCFVVVQVSSTVFKVLSSKNATLIAYGEW